MKEIGYCKDCKYWAKLGGRGDEITGRSICMNDKIKNAMDCKYGDEKEGDGLVWHCGIVAIDKGDIDIFTGPYFGCVHWEKR